MEIRTLLVDGSYLLQRSFHGAKDIYNSKGIHIGGIYQFLTTLRKLTKAYMTNKIVVIWDGEMGGKARYDIDKQYKANRVSKSWHNKIELSDFEIKREKEKRESILFQKKRIQAYIEEIFIRQVEVLEIEADDLIAAYCMQNDTKESIYLYTNDRDFSQLLDLNITILFANIEMPITKANYSLQFGHHYSNALIMKVITGDKADNIQGIKGIGEDTILNHFPDMRYKKYTVREICKEADRINKERVANGDKPLKVFENLLSNVDRLIMNYKLVNLRQPFLNEEAREALIQLDAPLDPTDRGSKNLIKMMNEDEFLTIYTGTFPNYVEPFYTVIMNEKELLREYNKNNRGKL
jgi:5'-3' exonuclease